MFYVQRDWVHEPGFQKPIDSLYRRCPYCDYTSVCHQRACCCINYACYCPPVSCWWQLVAISAQDRDNDRNSWLTVRWAHWIHYYAVRWTMCLARCRRHCDGYRDDRLDGSLRHSPIHNENQFMLLITRCHVRSECVDSSAVYLAGIFSNIRYVVDAIRDDFKGNDVVRMTSLGMMTMQG